MIKFETMKHLPLLIVLAVALGCGKSTSSNVPPTPEPPAIAVTTAQLAQKYKANELAADNEYRTKRLEITGKVAGVKEVLGSVFIDLAAPDHMTVTCHVPDERRAEAAKLKTGETATLIGTGNGLFGSTVIQVDDCRVK